MFASKAEVMLLAASFPSLMADVEMGMHAMEAGGLLEQGSL
jgi:hypothetical protein